MLFEARNDFRGNVGSGFLDRFLWRLLFHHEFGRGGIGIHGNRRADVLPAGAGFIDCIERLIRPGQVMHGDVELHLGFAGTKADDRAVKAVALVQFREHTMDPHA